MAIQVAYNSDARMQVNGTPTCGSARFWLYEIQKWYYGRKHVVHSESFVPFPTQWRHSV